MLKLILDSIDSLDAALKPLYKKGDDGKFHLDAEVEDVSGLKSALAKERDTASALAKQIKNWQALGKQPEEISALLEQQDALQRQKEELERMEALKKGEYQKVLDGEAKKREQMAAQHAQALAEAGKKTEAYRSRLEQKEFESRATAAILEAKGVPQLLLPILKGRVKAMETDGTFDFQMLDPAGNPMPVDAAGKAPSFKELVDSFRADAVFGRAFEGTNASGGGAPSTNGKPAPGAKTMPREAFFHMSPTEQLAFSKSGGAVTD